MAEIVSFSRTPEEFSKYAQRGIDKQLAAGKMTRADADLILEFVNSMRIQNNISEARAYKLTNALSNICRFIKTPLMDNTVSDIYTAVNSIKNGKKLHCKNMKNKGELSQNSKRDYINFLRRFYLWAIDEGYCDLPSEKIRKIKPPSPERITKTAEEMLTPEEILRMIDSCRGVTGIRDKAILSVLYEAGLRINELGKLLWSDVKFEAHFVKINVSSKTGIPRYIPLTTSRGYLAAWRAEYPDGIPEGDKPVFLTSKVIIENKGTPEETRTTIYKNLTYNYIRKHIREIGQKAGIQKNVSCHIWRHSRVTGLMQDGFSESVIKMMCWGSLTSNMLANYGHLCNNDIDAAVAKAAGLAIEEDKSKDVFKNKICPRCHHINSPTAAFCEVCGAAVSAEAALELETAREEIHADETYISLIQALQKKVEALEALQNL